MISINLRRADTLSALEKLGLITLPEPRKRRLLARIGRDTITASRRNARAQRSPEGEAWSPRKKKGRKRSGKMITGLPRLMTRTGLSGQAVTLGWKNRLTGHLAKRHQEGLPERMSAEKAKRMRGQPDYQSPATRPQAKALRELGYRIPGARKGRTKAPSLKWITQNLNQGQAGMLIKKLAGSESKRSWNIDVAARPFAGVNINQAVDIIRQELTRG